MNEVWRLRPSWIEVLYLAAVVGLVGAEFVSPEPTSYWAFGALVLVTLPTSILATMVTVYGGVLLFGPGEWGIVPRMAVATLWLGVALAEVVVVRAIMFFRRAQHAEVP